MTALAKRVGQILAAIVPKLSPAAKAQFENAFKSAVQSLVTQGWLAAAQGATLDAFVAGLWLVSESKPGVFPATAPRAFRGILAPSSTRAGLRDPLRRSSHLVRRQSG